MSAIQSLQYKGKAIFSYFQSETPNDEGIPLRPGACYAYIFKGEGQDLAAPYGIRALKDQVIASLCGLTLGNVIAQQEAGKVSSIVAHLDPTFLKEIFADTKPEFWQELDRPVSKYLAAESANALIQGFFASLKTLFDHQVVDETLLGLKLKELIVLLLKTSSSKDILLILRSLFSDRQFSFREIVEAHIYEPISLNSLAAITNMSLSSFKRQFQEIYGESPARWLLNKRLEKLATLIRLREEPVAVLGYECGFNSPEQVSRAFKKKYGLSPSTYRLNYRKN